MKLQGSYSPQDFENEIYAKWQDANCFKAEVNLDKKPYTIIMPPPNVTSQAHIGHAFDITYQDILSRFHRMQGYEMLWVPGADHAAIATEVKIVDKLAKEGKTKEQIGRKEFDKEAWAWYNHYGDRIMNQFKRIGCSADYSHYRFTMDEKSTNAVLEAFIKLYSKGLIYRGMRQTNWCPSCESVISDDEVVYSDEKDAMYHIRYPFSDGSGYIIVATTRPETLFGDTAVAVNPTDERYMSIVGKELNLPLTDRKIPIIADEYVEKTFGTGMVKITPAHDPNDYEVGKRHNLKVIEVLGKDGKLNENCPKKYQGIEGLKARKQIEEELKSLGLLEKVVPYTHSVGHCERCHTRIEPRVTEQWFVAMKELVKPAIKAVKTGELKIYPKRFEKNYLHWLENIRDWCISRQIWTGHRIPIYYCDDCGQVVASKTAVEVCPHCGGKHLHQDPDVLDTWFSSALWPFSTLGWPEKTKEMEYFFPTDCLVTAFDILTQWVTKMVYMSYECTGKVPFKNVLIHGLVRDELGRKMSKSLGNGVDPLEMADKYGADALRLALMKDMAMGMDTRFSVSKIDNARGFINKLWNASKFVQMHMEGQTLKTIDKVKLDETDKWILCKLNDLTKVATQNLEKFDVAVALSNIYNFTWNDFCDWYIELSKTAIFAGGEQKQDKVSVLSYVLENILKLLHPFIPFVTEKIYDEVEFLNKGKFITLEKYPTYSKKLVDKKAVEDAEKVIDAIVQIRALKKANEIADNKSIDMFASVNDLTLAQKFAEVIKKMCIIKELTISEKDETNLKKGALAVTKLGNFYLIETEENKKEQIEKLSKEIEKLNFEISRSEKMLGNERFVEKAPKELVAAEKEKLQRNKDALLEMEIKLKGLQNN